MSQVRFFIINSKAPGIDSATGSQEGVFSDRFMLHVHRSDEGKREKGRKRVMVMEYSRRVE